LLADLDRAARHARSTLFRLVLSAVSAALAPSQPDHTVAVRSPDGNRDQVGAAGLVGWFSNLIVYRTDLSGDPTLAEVADRVSDTYRRVQAHKDATHYDLMRALRPADFGRPRPGTWVVLNHVRPLDLRLPGLITSPTGVRPASIQPRMIEFELVDRSDSVVMVVNYDARRYPQAQVARLVERVVGVLTRLAQDPAVRLSTVVT
jgi:hypothetical protein